MYKVNKLIAEHIYMIAILLILSFLVVTPVSAAPQKQAGNPTLNVNAAQTQQKKKQQTFQPQQPQQQKKTFSTTSTRRHKQPVRYLETERNNQLTVPMQSTSALRDSRQVTPTMTPTTTTFEPQAVGSSAAAPLYQTSEQGRKGATAHWGCWNASASAEGLMASGSRYTGNEQGSGPTTTVTTPGPRQTNGYPDIPFPDEPVPVGDFFWPLAILALAYALFAIAKRRKRA